MKWYSHKGGSKEQKAKTNVNMAFNPTQSEWVSSLHTLAAFHMTTCDPVINHLFKANPVKIGST